MDLLYFAIKIVFVLVALIACAYASWRGGVDERIGVAIVVLATVGTALATPASHLVGLRGRWGNTLVDGLTLLAFGRLMLTSRRFWPIWATGFQGSGFATNTTQLIFPVAASPYLIFKGVWAWPILLVLVLGARRHHKQKRNISGGASDRSPGA